MKNTFKHFVFGAVFFCVGAAHAAFTTVVADGVTSHRGFKVEASSDWSFSSRLMGALEWANASLAPTSGAQLTWGVRSQVDEFGESYEEVYPTLHSDVSKLTVDEVTGKVLTTSSVGGVKMSASKASVLRMGGGWAEFGELDARFQADGSVSIFGVITGQGTPYLTTSSVSVNYSGLLFTVLAADAADPRPFVNVSGTHETTLHHLVLSTAGLDALVSAFGAHKTGMMYSALQLAATDFGDLALTVRVTAVPEPSVWVLLGFGLAAVGVMSRRCAK